MSCEHEGPQIWTSFGLATWPTSNSSLGHVSCLREVLSLVVVLTAGVVKLVDTPDLGSGDASRGGSSPSTRTKATKLRFQEILAIFARSRPSHGLR